MLKAALLPLGIVVLAVGIGLLVLPYDAPLDTPALSDEAEAAGPRVPCVAPVHDLLGGGERDGWVNDAPGEGPDERAGGELCRPESTQRLGGGALAIVAGGAAVLLGLRARFGGARRSDGSSPP